MKKPNGNKVAELLFEVWLQKNYPRYLVISGATILARWVLTLVAIFWVIFDWQGYKVYGSIMAVVLILYLVYKVVRRFIVKEWMDSL